MSFILTFNQIVCVMPSSGINREAAEAASKILDVTSKGLDVASKIADLTGPEGEAVGVVLEVAGDLASIGSAIADLVMKIDTDRRNSGMDPDNFYIGYSLVANEAEHDSLVLYPQQGTFAGGTEPTVDLAKGAQAPGLPRTFTGLADGFDVMGKKVSIPHVACFWDHDMGANPDDLLVSIPVNSQSLGSFKKTFYNAMQDCVYYVDWTLTETED